MLINVCVYASLFLQTLFINDRNPGLYILSSSNYYPTIDRMIPTRYEEFDLENDGTKPMSLYSDGKIENLSYWVRVTAYEAHKIYIYLARLTVPGSNLLMDSRNMGTIFLLSFACLSTFWYSVNLDINLLGRILYIPCNILL